MVAVDERDVGRRQAGQHVVARPAVEVVAAGERLLVLGRVELRHGIDDVQLAVGPEAVEHPHGGLAPQRADLDDPAGAERVDHRRDDVVPERVHPQAALPR